MGLLCYGVIALRGTVQAPCPHENKPAPKHACKPWRVHAKCTPQDMHAHADRRPGDFTCQMQLHGM
eukprot:7735079-Pyramimonas_sp.AAC.1